MYMYRYEKNKLVFYKIANNIFKFYKFSSIFSDMDL